MRHALLTAGQTVQSTFRRKNLNAGEKSKTRSSLRRPVLSPFQGLGHLDQIGVFLRFAGDKPRNRNHSSLHEDRNLLSHDFRHVLLHHDVLRTR